MTSLEALVRTAKADPATAEQALAPLLASFFPSLQITGCRINSGSKVSLNSVNGFVSTADGASYFFKFHAEEGEEKSLEASEYYRADALAKAGWPIITPVMASTQAGQQCVIYEKLDAPTAYDLFGKADAHYLATRHDDEELCRTLLKAEEDYLRTTTAVMLESLAPASPDNEKAALHQLFSHRVHGVKGTTPRLDLFYTGKPVRLPDGATMPFEALAALSWVINGEAQEHSLASIIALIKKELRASATAVQPSVLCHGDDHNGNKFLMGGRFVAFDPAFAGRVPVLLAPIKALLHNACLHPFWYYEPERVHPALNVTYAVKGETLHVTHNAGDVLASPLRDKVFALHRAHVWQPLMAELGRRGGVKDAPRFISAAAFACPFLALNMIDAARAPQAQLSLFNLAQCVALFHNKAIAALADL